MRKTDSELAKTWTVFSKLAAVPPVTPFIPVQLNFFICTSGKSHLAGILHE